MHCSADCFKQIGRLFMLEYKQMLMESKAEMRNEPRKMLGVVWPLPVVRRTVPNTGTTPRSKLRICWGNPCPGSPEKLGAFPKARYRGARGELAISWGTA